MGADVVTDFSLPASVSLLLQPLFAVLPPAVAMPQLVVDRPGDGARVEQLEAILNTANLGPALRAALWIYVDDLDRSHRISQGIDDATGAYWHGIMHRREGDFANSHYWFRKVGNHPAMASLSDYNAHTFIDTVADWSRKGGGHEATLVEMQRCEWIALFHFCAGKPG